MPSGRICESSKLIKSKKSSITCFRKKKKLQSLPLYYSSFQDSNFSTALELAVRFGKTLVIQEMDGVEPVLFPILRGDFISQGEDRHLLLAW